MISRVTELSSSRRVQRCLSVALSSDVGRTVPRRRGHARHRFLEGGTELRLGPWQAVTIPAGTIHRTRAIGRTVNLCFEELAADTVFVDSTGA